jgi:hypothetical protein
VTGDPDDRESVHLEVHLDLDGSEKDKISWADLSAAVVELLARKGVDLERSEHEVFQRGICVPVAGRSRAPRGFSIGSEFVSVGPDAEEAT